ncbi:MAG TPA: MFS transporter [Acidimicrobiia bacterium]|nr:MFS transporter [Acidimicrobiia bacterium]
MSNDAAESDNPFDTGHRNATERLKVGGDGGRADCPVLPCVPTTAINADRIGQNGPTDPSEPDVGQSRQLTAALIVISTAQLMVVLDATIVAVALPSIQRALHFSTANLQWIITAYTLTFGGLLLLGGRLGDVFGRRRTFVFGLVVFSLASLLGGLATTSAWLIAARAVQGIGGAIAAPAALALIGDTFPEGPARTRATGIYAAMSGAGGAIGLLLGGILTDFASWRWVLFVNAPLGALVVVAAPRVLKRSAPRGGKLDIPGALFATSGMTALVYGLVRAPGSGWANAITVTSLAGGVVLLVGFAVIEVRSDHPMLPPRLLSDRNRSASYIVMFCLTASIFAVSFFLTLLLQTVMGYSPLKTGLAFLPFSIGIAATSQAVAKLMPRIPPRVFVTIGPLLSAIGLLWLSRVHAPISFAGAVLGPLLVLALGLGFSFVPLVLGATSGVQPADLGVASAVLNTAQQVGGTLGLAVLVTVAAAATRSTLGSGATHSVASPVHGYSVAFVVAAGIAFAGFLVALAAIRTPDPIASTEGAGPLSA